MSPAKYSHSVNGEPKDQVIVLMPLSMIESLDGLAKAQGTQRSAIVRAAVQAYLGKEGL